MAIDTATKRASCAAHVQGTCPVPDGTIGEGDRAHIAWLYSGIDYDAPTAAVAAIGNLRRTLMTYISRWRR